MIDKVFMLQKDGSSISWKPDANPKRKNKWDWQFLHLKKYVNEKFGINLDGMRGEIIYDELQSGIDVNMGNHDNHNNNNVKICLTRTNIGYFWSLLQSSENVETLYFAIGEFPKRVVIVSAQGRQIADRDGGPLRNIIDFSKEKETNWFENYQRLIRYLNEKIYHDWKIDTYNTNTNNKYNTNDDHKDESKSDISVDFFVNYSKMPYRIFYVEKSKNGQLLDNIDNLNEYHTFASRFKLEIEVSDGKIFSKCFENDLCYLFVEYKCYVLFEYHFMTYQWVPKKFGVKIDWDKEFKSMKNDICEYFNVRNNNKIAFATMDSNTQTLTNNVLKDDGDLEVIWNDLIEDSQRQKHAVPLTVHVTNQDNIASPSLSGRGRTSSRHGIAGTASPRFNQAMQFQEYSQRVGSPSFKPTINQTTTSFSLGNGNTNTNTTGRIGNFDTNEQH